MSDIQRAIPQGSNPNKYEPNPQDDRTLSGEASATYLDLTNALESVVESRERHTRIVPAYTSNEATAMVQAENALRRCLWQLVASHGIEEA